MSGSDAVASAGIRPWLSCVLVGIVRLAPALLRSPEDGIAIQDPGAVLEASGVSLAIPAPPQSPGPASKLSASEGDTLPDLKAPLSVQATREDPEAILTTDSPALNFAKEEGLSVPARDLLQQKGLAAHSAGPGYDAPWIRDSCARGMIANDTYPQPAPYANSELRLWLAEQSPSGQWVSNPRPGYLVETSILTSAVLDAYRGTGDRALLAEALPRLRRGWAWLRSNANERDSTNLLWTPLPTAGPRLALPVAVDWADQVGRRIYAAQVNLLWFRATQSLAVVENVLGNAGETSPYAAFATGIRSDINRLPWATGHVQARNAAPAEPFGHYRSRYPAERDYFELDTNFQAILYGVADAEQSASILAFVSAHADYLLDSASGAPPARTVYGDYAPADYALIRSKLGDGAYHNAYWLSTGGLAAAAYQRADQPGMQRRVVDGMVAAFRAGQAGGSASEWYDISGRPGGVSSYHWSARSYLHALYRAYVGIDDDWASMKAENLCVMEPCGEAIARMRHLGKRLRVQIHGRGRVTCVLVNGQAMPGFDLIPETLLHDGSNIDVYAGE